MTRSAPAHLVNPSRNGSGYDRSTLGSMVIDFIRDNKLLYIGDGAAGGGIHWNSNAARMISAFLESIADEKALADLIHTRCGQVLLEKINKGRRVPNKKGGTSKHPIDTATIKLSLEYVDRVRGQLKPGTPGSGEVPTLDDMRRKLGTTDE